MTYICFRCSAEHYNENIPLCDKCAYQPQNKPEWEKDIDLQGVPTPLK